MLKEGLRTVDDRYRKGRMEGAGIAGARMTEAQMAGAKMTGSSKGRSKNGGTKMEIERIGRA